MEALILEDDDDKAREIEDVFRNVRNADSWKLCREANQIGGKRQLRDREIDVLVLDIMLPNRVGDPLNSTAGLTLLTQIASQGFRSPPRYIVVVSEFDDLLEETLAEHGIQVAGCVRYDRSSVVWKAQLSSVLERISPRHREASLGSNGTSSTDAVDVELAVVCALDSPELDAILRLDWHWSADVASPRNATYHKGWISNRSGCHNIVAIACPQVGMAATAVVATEVINRWKPRYLCMTGIAAGYPAHANLGDVIVGETFWDYTSGKFVEDGGFAPNPLPIDLDVDLANQFKQLARNESAIATCVRAWPAKKPDTTFRLVLGTFLSGGAVVGDVRVRESIRQQSRKVVGVDMEAYGLMCACKFAQSTRPIGFVLKGVSDFADGTKNDDWHPYAAFAAARVLELWAQQYL